MIKLKKTEEYQLSEEVFQLHKENKDLFFLLKEVDEYVGKKYNKAITVTHIYRTPEQQDEFYKDDERHKVKKRVSPHQLWHAFDLRSRDYTQEQIDDIVKFINDKFDETNYYNWTSKCHNIGLGDHFHVQFIKK